jgi:cell division transport system permease protein
VAAVIRHAVAEGWLLLRQRLVVSLVLAMTLAIPISLAGIGLSISLWLRPLAAQTPDQSTVAVLLHPSVEQRERQLWIDEQMARHPEWTVREVPQEDLVRRLERWFPYLDRLVVEKQADLPPLLEIATTDPETVGVLASRDEVLAVGPLTSIEHILQRVARRTAAVAALLSALLLAGAVMLSGVWVHLELYRHASELTIMRLVGATEGTIRGPFLVAVAAPGLLAAVLSVVVTAITVSSLDEAVTALGLPPLAVPVALAAAQPVAALVLPLSAAAVILARYAADAVDR